MPLKQNKLDKNIKSYLGRPLIYDHEINFLLF